MGGPAQRDEYHVPCRALNLEYIIYEFKYFTAELPMVGNDLPATHTDTVIHVYTYTLVHNTMHGTNWSGFKRT